MKNSILNHINCEKYYFWVYQVVPVSHISQDKFIIYTASSEDLPTIVLLSVVNPLHGMM